MSGITPILDTLLHQVLGRRGGFAAKATLDDPITPAQAGKNRATLHSDSRLDPRPPTQTKDSARVVGRQIRTGQAKGNAPSLLETTLETTTSTRLSVAARAIADILARYPAPKSTLHGTQPLLDEGEPLQATRLASQLRNTIEESGLFYESHLRQWHRGTRPLSALLREPQMQLALARARLAKSQQGAQPSRQGARLAQPAEGESQVSLKSLTSQRPLTYQPDGKLINPATPTQIGATQENAANIRQGQLELLTLQSQHHIQQGSESTIRHQLELLANPIIRWQGQPWAGVFMALLLQPPIVQRHDENPQETEDDQKRQEENKLWQSRLTLHMARLGKVKVNIKLAPTRVKLDVHAQPNALEHMRQDSNTLRARLRALGFREVALNLKALVATEEVDDEGIPDGH